MLQLCHCRCGAHWPFIVSSQFANHDRLERSPSANQSTRILRSPQGKPTGKILDEQADKWAFMLNAMDFEPQY